MKGKSCAECLYCGVSRVASAEMTLICRFDPPKAVLGMQQMQSMTGQTTMGHLTFTMWPTVQREDWCGKFKTTKEVLS